MAVSLAQDESSDNLPGNTAWPVSQKKGAETRDKHVAGGHLNFGLSANTRFPSSPRSRSPNPLGSTTSLFGQLSTSHFHEITASCPTPSRKPSYW